MHYHNDVKSFSKYFCETIDPSKFPNHLSTINYDYTHHNIFDVALTLTFYVKVSEVKFVVLVALSYFSNITLKVGAIFYLKLGLIKFDTILINYI